jgi:exonuclease SbcD
MKQPIVILTTDWHIDKRNLDQIRDLVVQMLALANKLEINKVILLGDVFQARKSQELSVLVFFIEILNMFKEANVELIAFPGNHDKVDLNSLDSYLDPFDNFPNFKLIRDYSCMCFVDKDIINIHLIPYFEDKLFLEKLNQCEPIKDERNVLLIHQGVTGAKNNDGSIVDSDIKLSMFKKFNAVFSGHYHDRNGIYIGSIAQNNFGEDTEKGFTVLYDDLSTKFIKSKFKEYHKVVIDLKKLNLKDIDKLAVQHMSSGNNIRFEFVGDKTAVDSIDIDKYRSLGIDVKRKNDDIDGSIEQAENDEVIEFNNTEIINQFGKFCESNGISDPAVGLKYLKKQLK